MADTEVPEIELIIKASTIDGRRKGACIFCQVKLIFKQSFAVSSELKTFLQFQSIGYFTTSL